MQNSSDPTKKIRCVICVGGAQGRLGIAADLLGRGNEEDVPLGFGCFLQFGE